jgi:lipoprotein-anchoring transpeptidase ErfK/SrfK
VTPWNLGLRLEVRDFVRDTLQSQREKPIIERVWHRIFGVDGDISLAAEIDDDVLDEYMARIDGIIDRAPEDARMELTGDTLKVIPHKLGRDMRAREGEKAIVNGLSSGDKTIQLPVATTEPALKADAFTKVLVINTSANTLDFYRDGKVSKTYGVATGTGGYPTPHGQFRVTAKRRNPTWVNPNSDWSRDMPPYIGPGRNNPLGTRALNLSASGIRIHGTPDDASIGTNASHGCIRMHMHEVEELFEQVDVGTPVLIIG